jgi:hypothetical protein
LISLKDIGEHSKDAHAALVMASSMVDPQLDQHYRNDHIYTTCYSFEDVSESFRMLFIEEHTINQVLHQASVDVSTQQDIVSIVTEEKTMVVSDDATQAVAHLTHLSLQDYPSLVLEKYCLLDDLHCEEMSIHAADFILEDSNSHGVPRSNRPDTLRSRHNFQTMNEMTLDEQAPRKAS